MEFTFADTLYVDDVAEGDVIEYKSDETGGHEKFLVTNVKPMVEGVMFEVECLTSTEAEDDLIFEDDERVDLYLTS